MGPQARGYRTVIFIESAAGGAGSPSSKAATSQKNVFVFGLDEFNLRYLKKVRDAEHYVFHRLLSIDEVARTIEFDLPGLLEKAAFQLDAFSGKVDAIVGYWDFPTILSLPLLRRHVGLPGPSLESVLRCEHKYWSRLLQKEAAPEHVPAFTYVDPFADPDESPVEIDFPFWIKPVKAHSSKLGFRVRNRRQLGKALAQIREGIHQFADPMNFIMSQAELPEKIAAVHGGMCIAEAIISHGRQCTLEGYVFDGEVEVYGVVDSIRSRNRSSFARYEYPSNLPVGIRRRMVGIARRVMEKTGLEDSPFNMEFYWDRPDDRIWLLEINARLSKSHFPLFMKVEGHSHAEVMVEVALGRRPNYPSGEGEFRHAAKFMVRIFGRSPDSEITRAPRPNDIKALERQIPGTHIELLVHKGMKVRDIVVHDSYSHEVAVIFVGANRHSTLMKKYRACLERLGIEIDGQPLPET